MTFLIVGEGERTVECVEGEPQSAPVLTIEYVRTTAFSVGLGAATDANFGTGGGDVSEVFGSQYVYGKSEQLWVGRRGTLLYSTAVRFENLGLAPGQPILSAYLQLTANDEETAVGLAGVVLPFVLRSVSSWCSLEVHTAV
jgi:hypothetical protein